MEKIKKGIVSTIPFKTLWVLCRLLAGILVSSRSFTTINPPICQNCFCNRWQLINRWNLSLKHAINLVANSDFILKCTGSFHIYLWKYWTNKLYFTIMAAFRALLLLVDPWLCKIFLCRSRQSKPLTWDKIHWNSNKIPDRNKKYWPLKISTNLLVIILTT